VEAIQFILLLIAVFAGLAIVAGIAIKVLQAIQDTIGKIIGALVTFMIASAILVGGAGIAGALVMLG